VKRVQFTETPSLRLHCALRHVNEHGGICIFSCCIGGEASNAQFRSRSPWNKAPTPQLPSHASISQPIRIVEPTIVAADTTQAVITFKVVAPVAEGEDTWNEAVAKRADLSAFAVELRDSNILDFTSPWLPASVLKPDVAPDALVTQLWRSEEIPSPIVRGAMISAPGIAIPTARQIREGSLCCLLTGLRPNSSYLIRFRPLSADEHAALKTAVSEVIHLAGGAYELLPQKELAPSFVAAEKRIGLASPQGSNIALTTPATLEAATAALEAVFSKQLAAEAATTGTMKRRRRVASTNATAYLLSGTQRAKAAAAGTDMVVVKSIVAKEVGADSAVLCVTLEAASDVAAAGGDGSALQPILGGFSIAWSHDTYTARVMELFSREWQPAQADDDAGAILPTAASTSGKVPGKFRVMTARRRTRQFDITVQGLPTAAPIILRVWPLSEDEASSPEPVAAPAWPSPPTVSVVTAAPPAPAAPDAAT